MLFDKLKADRIQAMKDKDTLKKDLLGTLIGDCSKESKQPEDAKVIATIKKFISNIELNLKYPQGHESLQKLNTECEILMSYLPSQMSREAIATSVKYAIAFGHTNQGAINKYFKAEFEGRYDGKVLNEVIKEVQNG